MRTSSIALLPIAPRVNSLPAPRCAAAMSPSGASTATDRQARARRSDNGHSNCSRSPRGRCAGSGRRTRGTAAGTCRVSYARHDATPNLLDRRRHRPQHKGARQADVAQHLAGDPAVQVVHVYSEIRQLRRSRASLKGSGAPTLHHVPHLRCQVFDLAPSSLVDIAARDKSTPVPARRLQLATGETRPRPRTLRGPRRGSQTSPAIPEGRERHPSGSIGLCYGSPKNSVLAVVAGHPYCRVQVNEEQSEPLTFTRDAISASIARQNREDNS